MSGNQAGFGEGLRPPDPEAQRAAKKRRKEFRDEAADVGRELTESIFAARRKPDALDAGLVAMNAAPILTPHQRRLKQLGLASNEAGEIVPAPLAQREAALAGEGIEQPTEEERAALERELAEDDDEDEDEEDFSTWLS
jgi:hypothetical protein